MCQCVNMLAVCRHEPGKSLGTCLLHEPCALCVMSLQHVLMFQYVGCAHLNMLVVHGHGRGTHLSTCLVCAVCAVAIVVYMISDGLHLENIGVLRQCQRALLQCPVQ